MVFAFEHRRTFWEGLTPIVLSLFTAFLLLLPLILQPNFTRVLQDVNTFTFSHRELMLLPFGTWIANIGHVLFSFVFYCGPIFVLGLVYGFHKISKKKLLMLCFFAFGLIGLPVLSSSFILGKEAFLSSLTT